MAASQIVPREIMEILHTLTGAGYEAYLVGGCVRDILMDRTPHDWDITTSAECADVQQLFPKTIPTGIRCGTVTVFSDGEKAEVTTFRTDGVYTDHRKPQQVSFVKSLDEDLRRRDFTVNAMAMREDGSVVDLFDGRSDIDRRLIRCVGRAEKRFEEDALRMLRALRFSAVLGFSVEEETLAAVEKYAGLTEMLSVERIREEVEKILLSGQPEVIGQVIALGLIDRFLVRKPENIDFYQLRQVPDDRVSRWAAFCVQLYDSGAIISPERFVRTFRLDGKTASTVGKAASAVQDLPEKRQDLKMWISQWGRETAHCAARVFDGLRDQRRTGMIEEILHSGECLTQKELKIDGRDLLNMGCPPGEPVGHLLNQLLQHILLYPEENTKEQLQILAAQYGGEHRMPESKKQEETEE